MHNARVSFYPTLLDTTANPNAMIVTSTDDENVAVVFVVNDSTTQAAMLSGVTQGAGAKVNGTFTLTVTNMTADPNLVGVDTFNVFMYAGAGAPHLFFLSLATSDITVSSAADTRAVDLTASTFLDSGGSDAGLDASGSGERYGFSGFLTITDDSLDSTTSNTIEQNGSDGNGISIDAA